MRGFSEDKEDSKLSGGIVRVPESSEDDEAGLRKRKREFITEDENKSADFVKRVRVDGSGFSEAAKVESGPLLDNLSDGCDSVEPLESESVLGRPDEILDDEDKEDSGSRSQELSNDDGSGSVVSDDHSSVTQSSSVVGGDALSASLSLLRKSMREDKRRLRDFIIQMREANDKNKDNRADSFEREPSDNQTVVISDQVVKPLVDTDAASVIQAKDARQVSPSGVGEPSTTSSAFADNMRELEFKEEEHEEVDDDDVDMFAVDIDVIQKTKKKAKPLMAVMPRELIGPMDSINDNEGYYIPIVGEFLNKQYKLLSGGICGKGVFSNVVKATDCISSKMVAIKILRANDLMRRAGEKEAEVLRSLNSRDSEKKQHVIHLNETFVHRDHLCLVFDYFESNLRSGLKKHRTQEGGVTIRTLWKLARQMFVGLNFLHKCDIIHADIKPDNMLLSSNGKLMVCDLGSATDPTDCEITPYLVSRFYRAPEIILGGKYSKPIDIWSAGCTLYEMATGEILFSGRSNNGMLKKMMEVKGKFPNRMLRSCKFHTKYFTNNFTEFLEVDDSSLEKVSAGFAPSVKPRPVLQRPATTIYDLLVSKLPYLQGSSPELRAKGKDLADFIERCLILDPSKRMTAEESLRSHSFLKNPCPGS